MALKDATVGYISPARGGGSIDIYDADWSTVPATAAAVKTYLEDLPATTDADYQTALKTQQSIASHILQQQNVQGSNETGIEVRLHGSAGTSVGNSPTSTRAYMVVVAAQAADGTSDFTAR